MTLPMHRPDAGGDGELGLDPVCGMSVDRAQARANGLATTRGDVEYVFCGRGCKLDFLEDPQKYLDPGYLPTM